LAYCKNYQGVILTQWQLLQMSNGTNRLANVAGYPAKNGTVTTKIKIPFLEIGIVILNPKSSTYHPYINQPMKYAIIPLFCLHFLFGNAQTDTAVLQRQAYKLSMPVSKKTVYESDVPAGPFIVKDDILQIYPGETVFLQVEKTGDEINSVKVVKQNLHPEKTLTISFTQVVEKHVHQSMMLKIDNLFDKNLAYQALIFLMEQKKWVKTDVLPVSAGLSSYETWPEVIVTLALSGWRLVK
jgi:hypothetical protein